MKGSAHSVTSMAPISASATSVAVDPGLAAEPPHGPALVHLRHVEAHLVAGGDRLAELALVDGHEEHLLGAQLVGPDVAAADRARRLRHALDQQHAGEDRQSGKVAHELRLVGGDVLDADAGFVAVDLDDAVDHQERIAVRQQLQQRLDIGCAQLVAGLARRLTHQIPHLDVPLAAA